MKILTCYCDNQYSIVGTNYYLKKNKNMYTLMKRGSNVPYHSYIEEFCIFEGLKKVYIICVRRNNVVVYVITGRNTIQTIVDLTLKDYEEWFINLNLGIRVISFNSKFEFRYSLPTKIDIEHICKERFNDTKIQFDVYNTEIFNSVCVKSSARIWKYKL